LCTDQTWVPTGCLSNLKSSTSGVYSEIEFLRIFFLSGGTKKRTYPPFPAPSNFPPVAPAFNPSPYSLSISGLVMIPPSSFFRTHASWR
jgi:hypothetical protein